jgi:hypothetical protein
MGSSAADPLCRTWSLLLLNAVQKRAFCVQVCPAWHKLLRQPQAESVYRPRMQAAAPLYRALLDMHRQDGMTWQDAWGSYCSVCDGSAPLEQLHRLMGMSLESLTMRTPSVCSLRTTSAHRVFTSSCLVATMHGMQESLFASKSLLNQKIFGCANINEHCSSLFDQKVASL